MPLRILLAFILLPFWFLITRNTETPTVDEKAATIIENAPIGWRLENTRMAAEAALEERGDGHPKAWRGRVGGSESLRILAVGDSYTYGYGLTSRYDAWPALLEDELRQRGIDASVATYAEPGASLFSYSDWFDNLENCTPLGDCAPKDFDAVIVGFYANDFHPRAGDSITGGNATPPGPPSRITTSPFERHAGAAADNITRRAGAVPVYWMPLAGIGSNTQSDNRQVNWDPDRWWELIKDSGMVRVATRQAEAAVSRLDAAALMANPGEYHPSRALQAAYARDAAELFTKERTSTPNADELTVETTPGTTTRIEDGQATYTYAGDPTWFCDALTERNLRPEAALPLLIAPGPALEAATCRNGVMHLSINGNEHVLPSEPCMEIGSPHLRLRFRPTVTATLRVHAPAGNTVHRVVLDQDGNRVVLPAEQHGEETTVHLPETVGLLVTSGGRCGDVPSSPISVTLQR